MHQNVVIAINVNCLQLKRMLYEQCLRINETISPYNIWFIFFWLTFGCMTDHLTFISYDPFSRTRQHETSVKKPAEVGETAPPSSRDSLDNDSTSSVRILQLKTLKFIDFYLFTRAQILRLSFHVLTLTLWLSGAIAAESSVFAGEWTLNWQ